MPFVVDHVHPVGEVDDRRAGGDAEPDEQRIEVTGEQKPGAEKHTTQ